MTTVPRFAVNYGLGDLRTAVLASRQEEKQTLRPMLFPSLADEAVSVFPTLRGREALYLLLRNIGLKEKSRVGLPLFTCSVVSKVIAAAGMTPVFLEADRQTFGVDHEDLARKAESMDCLLLIHSFGYPADWERVVSAMQGKPIIGDCAHALGSSYQGRSLGLLATASFFSFGFFKPLGVGGGGCAVSTDPELTRRIESHFDSYRSRQEAGIIHAFRSFLYASAFRQPIYSLVQSTSRHGGAESDGSPGDYDYLSLSSDVRMRGSDRLVLERRLRNWKPDRNEPFWEEIRASLPKAWHIPGEPTFGEWNHFACMIDTGSGGECLAATESFRKAGVRAGRLYPNRGDVMKSRGYTGDCPEADRQSNAVFMLPTHSGLSTTEKSRILKVLREW